MGRSHAASGLLGGTVVVVPFSAGREAFWPDLLPVWPFPVSILFIALCGAGALVPDLDHWSSKITRSLGPITRGLSWVIDRISLDIYHATRGPGDNPHREGGHRLVTHTPVGAVAFGLIVTIAVVAHPVAAVVTLGLLCCLLIDEGTRLGRCLLRLCGEGTRVTGLWWLLLLLCGGGTWWVTTTHPGWWWAWGTAVALGCHLHREGDWCTLGGVPRRSWPRMVDGRRWDMHMSPCPFKTGGDEETTFVRPGIWIGVALSGATALGLLPVLFHGIGGLVEAIATVAGRG